MPRAESRKCGLLGADYAVENGRHRITKVYRGESWNPGLRAPLHPARGRREGGRVPAGRQRPGAARRGRGLPALRGDGRQADGAQGRPVRGRQGQPRGDGGAGRQRAGAAEPGLGGRQPPGGGQADRRQGGVRLPAGHVRARGTRGSTATSSPRPAATA